MKEDCKIRLPCFSIEIASSESIYHSTKTKSIRNTEESRLVCFCFHNIYLLSVSEFLLVVLKRRIIVRKFLFMSKVGDRSRGRPEGSLFSSYCSEM